MRSLLHVRKELPVEVAELILAPRELKGVDAGYLGPVSLWRRSPVLCS